MAPVDKSLRHRSHLLMTCNLQIIYQSTEWISIHTNDTNSKAPFTDGDHLPMVRWVTQCFNESYLFVYIKFVWPGYQSRNVIYIYFFNKKITFAYHKSQKRKVTSIGHVS